MVRATLIVLLLSLSCSFSYAQQCLIQFNMENSSRKVIGEVYTECHAPHSPPWGNWGVESNVGERINGHQFKGIYYTDGTFQWNSCTHGPWEAPNSNYYNYNGFTQQKGVGGVCGYGGGYFYYDVSCPGWDDSTQQWFGGCKDLDGIGFGPSNNHMELWELDQNDDDEKVTKLRYNDSSVYATMNCSNPYGCSSASGSWVSNNHNITVNAKIRVKVVGAWYLDSSFCNTGGGFNPW